MFDLIQLRAMRNASKYLDKKKRQKETKRNLITGLIFLAAFILLVVFY